MSRARKKRQAKRKRRDNARRRGRANASGIDPRIVSAEAIEMDGVPVTEKTDLIAYSRLLLPDRRVLLHQAPLPHAFYLVTAKELRDRGEAERLRVLDSLETERSEFGDVAVPHELGGATMDGLGRLGAAVILSVAAIEAYVNEVAESLDDDAVVTVERQGAPVVIERSEIVRKLQIGEKLDLVVPLATNRPSIKDQAVWAKFKSLRQLRDEVVHTKEGGRPKDGEEPQDPSQPGIFGRLLLGEGSRCVEDAAAVIIACEPTGLPDGTRKYLEI